MVILFADLGLVESGVMRVLELDVLQALVLLDKAVADDLHLRLPWDCLEIRMQDACVRAIEHLSRSVA